jgi:starch phosphorylase
MTNDPPLELTSKPGSGQTGALPLLHSNWSIDEGVRLPSVAYFSMEIGLDPAMPTYSGGLGVLAGDCLRAAADIGIPMIGVTLLHRRGYFRQHLDAHGNQTESDSSWSPEKFLTSLPARASVVIEGRSVALRTWKYLITGVSGHRVPVYFLDTSLEGNSDWDRTLTDHLYGGDSRYRLCQEVVLGIGGLAMLRALGHSDVQIYHMNEGHSALLVLGLLEEQPPGDAAASRDAVRRRCVFTTHTPVPAGHDQFPIDLVKHVLGRARTATLECESCMKGTLNMTYLALHFARYINGVAMRHGEISQGMFPNYPINSITNGVHAATWTAESFQVVYDRHMPEWRRDNLYLRYAVGIPLGEIQRAHADAKQALLAEVQRRSGVVLDRSTLTLGFARRATPYKRSDLLLTDMERLRRITRRSGPIQVVYAGKAHARDEAGKAIIRKIFEASQKLGDAMRIVYLEEYDMGLARYLCSGADVWLNIPQKPQEASGTSGMKAALNGVPSLSILDGWWLEGHYEGITGWAIGEDGGSSSDLSSEATSLYNQLEYVVLPLFYSRPMAFAEVMRSAIALNGSFCNAQRMLAQYFRNAYIGYVSTGR